MATLSLGRRSIAYDDTGSGPAVVLLHGLLMDRSMWDAQVEALRGDNRVVTIDAPGHGDTDPVEVGYDFQDWAGEVWSVLDAAGVEDAVIGGQSMGGWTALRCAAARPGRVLGLLLIDTSAQPENPVTLPQYEAFLQVALTDGVNEDLANVLLAILFSQEFAASPAADPWRKKFVASDPARFHAMTRAVLDRPDVSHLLDVVKVPALVVHGDEDAAIAMDRAEQLATAFGVPLHRIPGAGHASPHERPEIVTPILRDFLAGL
ncbi:MAG: alpha/beta fold hydrolase [Actinomycetota bacterium]